VFGEFKVTRKHEPKIFITEYETSYIQG